MLNLKTQMIKDISNTFFNENEFTERHRLNNAVVPMIVEYFTLSGKSLTSIEGIQHYNCTIHFPSKYYKGIPKRYSKISLDGIEMTVDGGGHDMGVTTIVLRGDASL